MTLTNDKEMHKVILIGLFTGVGRIPSCERFNEHQLNLENLL